LDTITHIVLGAAIGEAIAGRRLGKKAMLLGAVAQCLPDIDFIASFGRDTSHDVLAHRGFTHSFLFAVLATLLLALTARRWGFGRPSRTELVTAQRSGQSIPFPAWTFFFGTQLFVHIFLDAFNVYGTGWFEPFSHYRVSFNTLFVADPFFSVWTGVAFFALLILKKDSRARKYWTRLALTASSIYLLYGIMNKSRIDARVEKELARQGIAYSRYFSTPTPLNNWLWYIVAKDSAGFHIGYASVFDNDPAIPFRFTPRNDSLLAGFRSRDDVIHLLRFSQGYYTVDRWEDGLVFNDLRFGEIRGWDDRRARPVFHYFVERPDDNAVIVQRGRFAGWNGNALRAFIKRIEGN
jgi:inner membrane protein